jgi:hypothetical protein
MPTPNSRPAGDGAGQALRRTEEPGVDDRQGVAVQQDLDAEDGGGEAGGPDGQRLRVAATREVENGRARTECRALGKKAEQQAEHRATHGGSAGFTNGIDKRNEIHDALLRRLRRRIEPR